jgi:hypothetical protein
MLTIFSAFAAVGEHELTILYVSVAPVRAWVDNLGGGMSNGLTMHRRAFVAPERPVYVLTTYAASVAPGRSWVDHLLCMHVPAPVKGMGSMG